MAKETFILAKGLIRAKELEKLSNDQLGELFREILDYSNGRDLKELSDMYLQSKFDDFREFYDENELKYQAKVERIEKARENNPNNSTDISTDNRTENSIENRTNNNSVNDNVYVYDNDISNNGYISKGAKAPSRTFHKPTLLEVKEYCNERQNGIVAEQWYDYYEANGGKVGRNAMKDWKACIRSGERRRAEEQANKPKTQKEEMHELYLKALEEDAREEAERDKSGGSDINGSYTDLLPWK